MEYHKHLFDAGRATAPELMVACRAASKDQVLHTLLEVVTDFVLVLNSSRQVVALNQPLLKVFGLTEPDVLLGRRPGEVFGCIHSKGPEGCGTDVHCTACGALSALLSTQDKGVQVVEECRLTVGNDGDMAFDFEVVATPYSNNRDSFLICTLRDIGAAKRRNVLERVFFHDLINTAGGIHGLASLLLENEVTPAKDKEYKKWMCDLSLKLIDEINQQRQLLAAEKGEFKPNMAEFEILQVLNDVKALYMNHEVGLGKKLILQEDLIGTMISDEAILRRILSNLVKNALEATKFGGEITITFCFKETDVVFTVQNEMVMPEEVCLQIFKRSFSTKSGTGRGIGTYSVRLFCEKYLKGKVEFISRNPDGTKFIVTLPRGTCS